MSPKKESRWSSAGLGAATGGFVGFAVNDLELLRIVSYWGQMVPYVTLFAAVGAVFWRVKPLRCLLAAGALALGGLWLLVAFSPICSWLAHDLPRRDSVEKAAAVYVLGSSMQRDGELTTAAMSRLLHGLELLGQDLAPRLILPELSPPVPATYAREARAIMSHLGLQQDVLSVGPTQNTRDEAVAVGALFEQRGWEKLLLVTSPSHSRRASAAFEREGLIVISSPSVETDFDLERLEKPDDRIRAFSSLMHERLGLWYYARRGWIEEN
jgi:uncharacterized SAM-binding protein YcdF (DUF218 family)